MMNHQAFSDHQYSGYSSCPIVTGYGQMLLSVNLNTTTFGTVILSSGKFVDTTKSKWSMWILKNTDYRGCIGT